MFCWCSLQGITLFLFSFHKVLPPGVAVSVYVFFISQDAWWFHYMCDLSWPWHFWTRPPGSVFWTPRYICNFLNDSYHPEANGSFNHWYVTGWWRPLRTAPLPVSESWPPGCANGSVNHPPVPLESRNCLFSSGPSRCSVNQLVFFSLWNVREQSFVLNTVVC